MTSIIPNIKVWLDVHLVAMLFLSLLACSAAFNVSVVGTNTYSLKVTADGHWVTDQGDASEDFNGAIGTTGQLAVNGKPVHIDQGGYYVIGPPDIPDDKWSIVYDRKLSVNGHTNFFVCPEYNYHVGSAPIDGSKDIATCSNPEFVLLLINE